MGLLPTYAFSGARSAREAMAVDF